MTTNELQYRRLFQPDPLRAARPDRRVPRGFGDRREPSSYVYTEHITLAINVALATARPLLVRGAAGSGKSSLAADIARQNGWDFYAEVISSRTRAQDLLWEFDAVRRLRDAQAGLRVDSLVPYVRPGVLWRAFDPQSADDHGAELNGTPSDGAVVLLDEIDKTDPDTPNDLLGPLGNGSFRVTDLKLDVAYRRAAQLLVVITTNEERDLAPAFVRRCIVLQLPEPDPDWLVTVAREHFGPEREDLHIKVAAYVMAARERAKDAGAPPPSTAEYLDALAACRHLEAGPGDAAWSQIALATLEKWVTEPQQEFP